jgi:hypothetical protein
LDAPTALAYAFSARHTHISVGSAELLYTGESAPVTSSIGWEGERRDKSELRRIRGEEISFLKSNYL